MIAAVGRSPNLLVRGACICALLAALVCGCSSTNDPPATTQSGEKLTGTVKAFAANGPSSISPNDVQVWLQGTTYHAIADTGGHFEIDNIPAGVYNIAFALPGFDTMVYPAHHFIGVGNDIIDDAYLIQESSDSLAISGVSWVFTVSVSKIVTVIDTIIRDSLGVKDTIVLAHDSLSITYDTVQNANAFIASGKLLGNLPPGNLFVYSSLDSSLYPSSPSPQNPLMTEDAWLVSRLTDTSYKQVFQSPNIPSGRFLDTLARDAATLKLYSLAPGQVVYLYVVGHSNTAGLPATNGEYQHFSTTPYGPQAVRFKFIVP